MRAGLLAVGVLVLGFLSVRRVGNGVFMLLFPSLSGNPFAAVDIGLRYNEVQRWFAALPVYEAGPGYSDLVAVSAVYPPATMVLLYPVLGWPSLAVARWAFAAMNLAAVVWLMREFAMCGRAFHQTVVWVLVPIAGNAMGTTIGFGQLGLLSLAGGVLAVWYAQRPSTSLGVGLSGLLMLGALVKPSVAAPFFCLLGVVRAKAAFIAGVTYIGLTLTACAFQPGPPLAVIQAWLRNTVRVPHEWGGYGNLTVALADHLPRTYINGLSVGMLLALGLVLWVRRRDDPWILCGIVSIFSRLWTYHRPYDDILILPAVVSLRQFAMHAEGRVARSIAHLLVAVLVICYLFPHQAPLFEIQTLVAPWAWGSALAFLLFAPAPGRREEGL